VLIDRCDGIDERTLRRRLVHLERMGLIRRRPSPNGKRYVVRDDESMIQLAYGIDMEPLFALQFHLDALAKDCAREARHIAVLKARIRDALFHAAPDMAPELAEQARLSLRRSMTTTELQDLLASLVQDKAQTTLPARPDATQMTASSSQNDRHIQSSGKEAFEKKGHERQEQEVGDLTVSDCVTLAPAACEMAAQEPRTWQDIIRLAAILGPAIGLRTRLLQDCERTIGAHGTALAVMGLVQAFGRIRNPEGYLLSLLRKAEASALNPVRMFRSLVRPARGDGTWRFDCIPG
jgi:replication initiation protein RepC